MITDPINIFWCFIGLCLWPNLTLAVILWKLGHLLLAIFAFFAAEGGCSVSESNKRIK